jgi:hypothetical protein
MLNTDKAEVTYSGTGAQAEIAIENAGDQVGLTVVADGAGDDCDLEYRKGAKSAWRVLQANITSTVNKTILPPCTAVRLNITTNNSGAIGLEVASSPIR